MLIPDTDFLSMKKNSFKELVKYPFNERYLKIDNVNLCYIDEGKGLPLLFIHGLGGNLLHYKMNLPFFRENYRVIAVDLPGFGKSDKPELHDPVNYYVHLLKKFVKKLGIDELVIIGNSMGGHVGCLFAARYKKYAKGLILVDSAGMNELTFIENFFISNIFNESLLSKTPSFIMETTLKHNFYHAREEVNDILLAQKAMVGSKDYDDFCHAMEYCAKSMKNNPLDDILSEIQCPTLIVWGKNDRLIDVKHAGYFNKGIAGSKLIIYNSCGHISQLEKYEDFNKDVSQFLIDNELNKQAKFRKFFGLFKKEKP